MTATGASVLTSEGTTSTSYTDLTTTTDSVTVTVGDSGTVLVGIAVKVSASSAVDGYATYEGSGANTVTAADSNAARISYRNGGGVFRVHTGLNTGSTTFKMKYRSSSGSVTANFFNRYITAIPLEDLTTRTAAEASVTTAQATASATYTDLTTTTDTVTVTIGPSGLALVFIASNVAGSMYCSYAVSGATTRSADDDHAIYADPGIVSNRYGAGFLETGLASGSTTFKMKYRSGDGLSNAASNRRIGVIPL